MTKETGTLIVPSTIAAAIALACVSMAAADAATIDTGNPEIELRWDNTIRYNAGVRTEGINRAFYNNPQYDETEGRFKRGDLITNRIDVLSELDLVYQNSYGFRLSGAAWADGAYGAHSITNPALQAPGNYVGGKYNNYARRYLVGPSGEILDAFVFGRFDVGSTAVNLKLGQHTVYWGESLFSVGNSIAYSQGPVDTIKAATSPGVEAKELFLPQKQISAQAQLTNNVSVAAHYAFEWNPYRLVAGGTYFAAGDAVRSDFATTVPLVIPNGADIVPRSRGDVGANLRWSPEWLGGTAGLYYRKFDEKLPWGVIQLSGTAIPQSARFAFARGTTLYGLSLSNNVGSLSVGTELSYRKDTALNSNIVVQPAAGEPTYDEIEGARGNTFHALVNVVYALPKTLLWRAGAVSAEVGYSRLLSVTRNRNRFNGVGYACPPGRDKRDGCSTRDAWGINVNFAPAWPQAFPGWDLSLPVILAYQIDGNGAALGGGNEGAVTWAIGVEGQLYSRYNFSLRYVDARGQYRTDSAGVVTTTNGPNAVRSNHGWLSFTFRTTF
ncbi:MAG: hypothetical protein V7606_3900 [Burkholderiales bacterium]